MSADEHPLERIALAVTLVFAVVIAIVMSSGHDGLLASNTTGFAAGKSPSLCPVQLHNYQVGASQINMSTAIKNALTGCTAQITKAKCPAACPSSGAVTVPTIYYTEKNGDYYFAYAVCYKTCNYGSATDIGEANLNN